MKLTKQRRLFLLSMAKLQVEEDSSETINYSRADKLKEFNHDLLNTMSYYEWRFHYKLLCLMDKGYTKLKQHRLMAYKLYKDTNRLTYYQPSILGQPNSFTRDVLIGCAILGLVYALGLMIKYGVS